MRSLTGRLAPRVALLDPALLDGHVTQRVLRWAALGGSMGSGGIAAVGGGGVGDLSAMLAEDAAEVSRAHACMAGHGRRFAPQEVSVFACIAGRAALSGSCPATKLQQCPKPPPPMIPPPMQEERALGQLVEALHAELAAAASRAASPEPVAAAAVASPGAMADA